MRKKNTAEPSSGDRQGTPAAGPPKPACYPDGELYRSAFQNMTEGLALLEAVRDDAGRMVDCRFLDVNPAFEKLTRLERQAIVGRSFREVFPQAKAIWLQRYGDVVRTGESTRFESYSAMLRKHLQVYAYRLTSERFVSIYAVETARRKLEREKSRQSAAAAAAAQAALDTVNAMTAGLVLLTGEGVVLSINPAAAALTGLDAATAVGRPLAELLPRFLEGEDLKAALAALPVGRRGRVPDLRPLVFIGPGGKPVHVSPSVSFIRARSGCPQMAVLTLKDVTDLRRAQQRLALAIEASGAGTFEHWIPPSEGVFFSDRCAEILGYRNGELSRKKDFVPWLASRIHPEDGPRLVREYSDFAQGTNETCGIEVRALHRDGHYRHLEMFAKVAEHAPDEKTKRVAGLMFDVTQRKRAELEVKDSRERLRELASQVALAAERERRRLATELHDQAGQTLTLANLRLQALGALLETPETRTACREVLELFAEVIQQVRTFTFELSPPILYRVGLDAALEWLTEQFQERHHVPASFVSRGDRRTVPEETSVFMFQSVRELLNNVIKHAHATQVRVVSEADDEHIFVSVSDNGDGFDPETLTAVPTNGNGFGLFSVNERMRHIGGRMKIVSRPGKGTTVFLSAPKRPPEKGPRREP